jgi:hypothetical protein
MKHEGFARYTLHTALLLGILFGPEKGSNIFLRKLFDFYRTTWRYIPGDIIHFIKCIKYAPVAERSEACTVLARSEAGIVGSNPTQDMDV